MSSLARANHAKQILYSRLFSIGFPISEQLISQIFLNFGMIPFVRGPLLASFDGQVLERVS